MDMAQILNSNFGYMPMPSLVGSMRPYINGRGEFVVNIGTPSNPRERVVANALLRTDEWEQIDSAVMDVVRLPNIALNDFLRLGLTQPLDGMGVTVSIYDQLGDMTGADLSMNGEVRGEKDRIPLTPQSVPVPLIYKDFQIPLRSLESSRRGVRAAAIPLDTTYATVATRKVQDKVDDVIFNGDVKVLGGTGPIYGLTNKPQRIQKTSAQCGGGDFGTSGNAYKTINGAINLLHAAGFNGPFGCYLSTTQYGQINQLISNTAVSELAAIVAQIPDLAFLKLSTKLTDGEMILWQLTKDVADIAIAQDVSTVNWESLGGFLIDFRIFTCLTVRVKHDYNGACGVIHITGC